MAGDVPFQAGWSVGIGVHVLANRIERRRDGVHADVEDLGQQRVLGIEVVIDRGRLDLDGVGNAANRCLGVAALEEQSCGCVENAVAPGKGSAFGGHDHSSSTLPNDR